MGRSWDVKGEAHRWIHADRTVVIVPTYNERENLEPLVRRILAADAIVDLLIVDDNSPDGTGALAGRYCGRDARPGRGAAPRAKAGPRAGLRRGVRVGA